MQAVLPGDEALYIDEELVPHQLKGLVILLVPDTQCKIAMYHISYYRIEGFL